ncbi:condensation domain-containing protein [Mangrovihabitans endophyticus]|uniref:Carrier domain-containing protein n=1 Tax=Mangrovihabitans endophyticus TaxID=1751298 RepID=A0A8J3BS89_9ACTN|nr:condensation domain-containing protein [Mangrovihabitans endophyticus]GGK72634.1 hypothetical protein GCM10012284_03020 [Mangrovihabitans endophyticus]
MNTSVSDGGSTPTEQLGARLARLSPDQRTELSRKLISEARAQPEDRDAPRTEKELILARIWCEVLGLPDVGVNSSFFALGGDSISSLQISARAAASGLRLTSRQVLEAETITRLAEVAVAGQAAAAVTDVAVGESVLTPIQRWFFEQDLPDSHHWDQTVLVDVTEPLDEATLLRALQSVAEHHDVLRSRFFMADGEWRQEVRVDAPEPACVVVAEARDSDSARSDPTGAAVTAAQSPLNLATGPLMSVALLRSSGGSQRLLLVVHHLVVDGVSMRILLEDIETAYRAFRDGRPADLPGRTLSFRTWAKRLARYGSDPEIHEELDYWRAVPRRDAAELPVVTRTDVPNTVGRSRRASAMLPTDVVASIRRDVLTIPGTTLRDVLLAAFLMAWRELTGRSELQLDLESHGREPLDEPLDVNRTVGWFTAIYPARLSLLSHERGIPAVRAVARQMASIPRNGLGYGLLRYLGGRAGAELADLPPSHLTFNYLGSFERTGSDALFGPPVQIPGLLQSDAAVRRHLIDVVVSGVDGALLMDLIYPGDMVADRDATTLVSRFAAIVTELAEESRTAAGEGFRDFPLMRVDARHLAAIGRQIGQGTGPATA